MALALDDAVRRFLANAIAPEDWTHAAHVATFHHLLLDDPDVEAAYRRMKAAILAHNARVSPNGEHGRYHETVTRYFVGATVHAMAAHPGVPVEDLLADPVLDREAPFRHWSRDRLFAEDARSTWVAPDVDPLPWSTAAAPSDCSA